MRCHMRPAGGTVYPYSEISMSVLRRRSLDGPLYSARAAAVQQLVRVEHEDAYAGRVAGRIKTIRAGWRSGSDERCKFEHISFTYARQKIRGKRAAVCITQSPYKDEPCRLAVRL